PGGDGVRPPGGDLLHGDRVRRTEAHQTRVRFRGGHESPRETEVRSEPPPRRVRSAARSRWGRRPALVRTFTRPASHLNAAFGGQRPYVVASLARCGWAGSISPTDRPPGNWGEGPAGPWLVPRRDRRPGRPRERVFRLAGPSRGRSRAARRQRCVRTREPAATKLVLRGGRRNDQSGGRRD